MWYCYIQIPVNANLENMPARNAHLWFQTRMMLPGRVIRTHEMLAESPLLGLRCADRYVGQVRFFEMGPPKRMARYS